MKNIPRQQCNHSKVFFGSQMKVSKFSRKSRKRQKYSKDKMREKGGIFGGCILHDIYTFNLISGRGGHDAPSPKCF